MVDFLQVELKVARTGVFNVADMAITGGVLLLLWSGWRRKPPAEQESDSREAGEATPTSGDTAAP